MPSSKDLNKETVQIHIRHAIEKLSATNKTHAVAKVATEPKR